jgi:O-antigen/teichoic acid export membrane protein
VNFRSNAIAMLTGTVMAQALPLAASPLLTRLYSPEAFGLQTLFMGLAASLAVLATCRMDLAVVLPEGYEEYVPDGDNDTHHDHESNGDTGEE